MACECIKLIDEAFERAGKNTVLDIPLSISMSTGQVADARVLIGVTKRDSKKRERPMNIVPIFCPFCGVRYEAEAQSC